jgi:hypothetical protein
MPPFSVPRNNPPNWIDQLRTTVLSPEQSWAPAETVSLLVATRALRGWLTDPRDYEGGHKHGWRSAIDDFQHGLTMLGPDLASALDPGLAAAVAAVGQLQADITAPGNVLTRLQARRVSDRQYLDQLRTRWSQPGARYAAWTDLVEACRNPCVSYETLALRRDLFWQVVAAGDHDTGSMSGHLAGVLTNEAFYVDLARFWLGDIGETDIRRPSPTQDAGLTEAQQLALCERLLTKGPIHGHYVIWVAFDLAGPGQIHRTVGTVSFWEARWLRSVLEHGHSGPNFAAVPNELKPPAGLFTPNDLPNEPGVVLVRVDLNIGAYTDPVRAAAEQAEAVVALASFNIGRPQWRRMTGYLIAIDDRIRAQGSFHPGFAIEDQANSIYRQYMEAELVSLAPTLGTHLSRMDEALSEVVQAVHWYEQARRQPPLVAVLLQVRVLELLSQRVGVQWWYDYLDQYQQLWWIRAIMVSRLGSVVEGCIQSYDTISNPQDLAWLRALEQQITARQASGARSRDLRQGYDALPDLVRIFPPHDNLGRRVRNATDRLNLANLPRWRDELAGDWLLARKRLQRIRNALAHGGPIEEDSAESVRLFAEQLARWSLTDALQGLLSGNSVLVGNQNRKRWIERWDAGLSTAATVGDALVGPP